MDLSSPSLTAKNIARVGEMLTTGTTSENDGKKWASFITVQYFKVPNEVFFDQTLHEKEFFYRMFVLDHTLTKRKDELWLLTLKAADS